MIEPTVYAFMAIFAGAICGVFIPYLLKKMENPDGPGFKISYLYAMMITLIISSFAIIPETVDMSFRGIMTLFLAGLGLEGVLNKANTIRIKGIKR